MGNYRGIDDSEAWISRDLAKTKAAIKRERSARRLPGSSFSGVTVPNSSLQNPSAPGYLALSATNFLVPAAGANVIDSTILVPSGFTRCQVYVTARAFAYNSTAATDYLYCRAVVNGVSGNAVPVAAAASGAALNPSPYATVLSGLTAGATIPVQVWCSTATADWAANTSNLAELVGSVTWFA